MKLTNKQLWDRLIGQSRLLEKMSMNSAFQYPAAKEFVLKELKRVCAEMEKAR